MSFNIRQSLIVLDLMGQLNILKNMNYPDFPEVNNHDHNALVKKMVTYTIMTQYRDHLLPPLSLVKYQYIIEKTKRSN